MKLTNGEIFTAHEPLQQLITEKFPVKVSYGLAKLVSSLQAQTVIIESVRNSLVQKYGTLSKGQLSVLPENENFSKFADEFNSLMAEEIELDIQKVKLPEKVMDKDLEITPALLIALDKFIDV